MKRKSADWIRASLGTTKENDRAYVQNFHPGFSVMRGNKLGYSVYALWDFERGEMVEEVPVLTLHTTLDDLIASEENVDPVMANYFIPHPHIKEIFLKEGVPLIVGLGNFLCYKKSETPNVAYNFDPNFNIITIRAIKQIPADAELFFAHEFEDNQTSKLNAGEKKMGCGCNKNKKEKKKELPKEEPPKEELIENSQFKSMVDGKDLKSIKIQ